ncbi:putative hemin transport protein [Burkholderiales bacterium 8X]|nr:putative hemin transport protein [Burkholderiales bacterium 8X]
MTDQEIRERFRALRAEGRRHKDAAEALGISEGEAIAAHVGEHDDGLHATRLRGPWLDLLQALEWCGPVLALTRNTSTVHEKTGVYKKLSGGEKMGLALGEDIDLRLFFGNWHAGFAVSEAANDPALPPSTSLQFFDAHGVAVHKIFARPATDRAAFQALIEAHAAAQPIEADGAEGADSAEAAGAEPQALFRAPEPAKPPRPDAEIDQPGLVEAWRAMQDTHEFFGLLRRFEVERQQSFRMAIDAFTERADTGALREMLYDAAFEGTPIMVFVGSPGCIQIHSGPVQRIEPMAMRGMRWLNVLDPGFNLHLREDLVETVWIVRKPTSDGIVTSVEAFDREGGLMAMFFGVRKPGQAESESWRRLVAKLPRLEVAA